MAHFLTMRKKSGVTQTRPRQIIGSDGVQRGFRNGPSVVCEAGAVLVPAVRPAFTDHRQRAIERKLDAVPGGGVLN